MVVTEEPGHGQGLAFPRLASNMRKKRGVKKGREEEIDKHIIGWLKCEDPCKLRESSRKKTPKQGPEKLKLISVKGYRSIMP